VSTVELFDALLLADATAESFGISRQDLANLILIPKGLEGAGAEYLTEMMSTFGPNKPQKT
jgi:hypothetical protein